MLHHKLLLLAQLLGETTPQLSQQLFLLREIEARQYRNVVLLLWAEHFSLAAEIDIVSTVKRS